MKTGDYLYCIKTITIGVGSDNAFKFNIGEKFKLKINNRAAIVKNDNGEGGIFPINSVELYFETVESHRKRIIDNLD